MKTRFISVLLVLSLVLVPLFSVTAGAEEIEPIEYALPFTDEPVTLSLMSYDSWYSPASYTDNLPIWQEFEKRTGITIDFQVLPSAQAEAAVQTRLAAGADLPDIVAIPPFFSGNGVMKYVQDNVLVQLDPYIENGYMPDVKKLFEDYPALEAMMRTPDGSCYTVACQLLLVNEMAVNSILFRKDWVEDLGMELPTTIDTWEATLRAIKETDLNGNGKNDEIPLISGDIGGLLFFGTGFGFETAPNGYADFMWYDENNQVYSTLIDDRMKATVEWLNKMYEEGLIYPQIENDWDVVWSLYAQDVIGAYSATMNDYITRADGLVPGSDHIMIMPPWPEEGVESKIMMRKDVETHFGITTSCEHPELAAMWINYVYCSDEGYELKEYGIEGETFYYDENGERQYTDIIMNNPDGLGPHDALRVYGGAPSFLVFDSKEWFVKQFAGTKVLESSFDFEGKQIQTLPVMIPTIEENEILTTLQADLNTYWREMLTKFVIGTEPLENWDSYVAGMKSLGIDEIVSVYQAEFDRYRAIAG